ncbi:MAG: hypothetical protein WCX31_05725 [Salinivirgaceae bacterium]|jgi:hypothetical protein
MKKLLLQIGTISFLVSIVISCENTTIIDVESNITIDTTINIEYPTKLYKLDSVELSQLIIESPYPLDAYGLVCRIGFLNGGYSSINNADSVIDLAKKTLIQNSKFSNVTSDSSLILNSVERYTGPGDFSHWTVIFENQIYDGIEILNTRIIQIVTNTVTIIDGHHFNNIFIPEEGLLPIDTIKAKIVGKTIEYYDWVGIQEKIITHNSIVDDFIKKIYWFEKENYLEFRVVWQIPILYNDNPSDDLVGWGYVGWYIYVDILSGEILYILPTFIS